MNVEWLPYTILRAASLLAPRDQRVEWVKEWRSELWYISRRQTMRFTLGAFRDALWLRRNPSPATPTRIDLESPLICLAFLSTLAVVSIFFAVRLLAPDLAPSWPLRAHNLPGACIGLLLILSLFLPGTLAVWRPPARRPAMPWWSTLRRGVFLALKIALVQPMVLCGFVLQIRMGSLGILSILAFYAVNILVLRWVITDQLQRCPVCLRILTAPVGIGSPAQTFLEWYGAELTCSRGHGLLHISENSSSASRNPQWLSLDDSWCGLFRGGR